MVSTPTFQSILDRLVQRGGRGGPYRGLHGTGSRRDGRNRARRRSAGGEEDGLDPGVLVHTGSRSSVGRKRTARRS